MPEIDVTSRLLNALFFGPSMLLFYILSGIWLTLIFLQRFSSKSSALVTRFCFIICCLLIALGPAVWIHFWTTQALEGFTQGAHDPYMQALASIDAGLASLIVTFTGTTFLVLTGFLVKTHRIEEVEQKEAEQSAPAS